MKRLSINLLLIFTLLTTYSFGATKYFVSEKNISLISISHSDTSLSQLKKGLKNPKLELITENKELGILNLRDTLGNNIVYIPRVNDTLILTYDPIKVKKPENSLAALLEDSNLTKLEFLAITDLVKK